MLNYYKTSFILFLKSEFGEGLGNSGGECKPTKPVKNPRRIEDDNGEAVFLHDNDRKNKLGDPTSDKLEKILSEKEVWFLRLSENSKIKSIIDNIIYYDEKSVDIGKITSSKRDGDLLIAQTEKCGELIFNTKTGGFSLNGKVLKE